jgi:hypothetical protein
MSAKTLWASLATFLLFSTTASAELVGLWTFDNSGDLNEATIGADLASVGAGVSTAPGVLLGDGAAQVDKASYLTVTHGISPTLSDGDFVNAYTVLMDIRYPTSSANKWMSLFQTSVSNGNDGDLFIAQDDASVGLAALGGYSSSQNASYVTSPDVWYRVIFSVDNGVDRSVYVDGVRWLDGNAGALDDRHSLDPVFHVFADESGEDETIYVTNLAVWDEAITPEAAAALGGAGQPVPEPSTLALVSLAAVGAIAGRRRFVRKLADS